MRKEFRLMIKKKKDDKYEIIEWNADRHKLEDKQKKLQKENPDWEVVVVKQNYNVSWKENIMAPNPHYINMIINFSILGTLIYVAIQVS